MAKKDKVENSEIVLEVSENFGNKATIGKLENSADVQEVAEILGNQDKIKHLLSGEILVICREKEGFRRAGISHKRVAIYTELTLKQSQIEQLANDPAFVVVRAV